MFLKRIEAEGFKSFASKTIISFPTSGLVGFVGPNGSGKSNINDAIKWVLGEQSAKSLRGGSMTDIIFAGSKDKKPSDLCEVTLIFNNSNKILNIEFEEVSITRRLYREQQDNEYFINKEKCRLKDIRYLMMNTGLGKNSFSIVSQGSITKLADAKPLERKSIFEEAAGVSVYKEQKIESLRKLDRTTQNLNIIEISVDELKKQVKPLEKQAAKARIFLDKRKILEKYEVSLIAEELKYDLDEVNKVNKFVKSSELEKDLKSNLVNNNQSKTTNINQKLIILEDEISQLEHKQREIQSRINELSKNKIEAVQENIDKNNISKLIDEMIQEELIVSNQLETTKKVIDSIKSQRNNTQQLISETMNQSESFKYELSRFKFEKEAIDNKIKNKSYLSHGPAAVIKNKQMFPEVIDVISNLFHVDKKHEIAIQTALGYVGSQNIVVKTDVTIKNILQFLKEGKYGRATFLPLNIIHERKIDEKSLTILKQLKGFEGVASDVVQNNDEVLPAINFLLGNNVIFDNIDNGLSASKLVNGRYKIITLDGDVINSGFSITGGTKSSASKTLSFESKIEELIKNISQLENDMQGKVNEINVHKHTLEELDEQLNIKNISLARFAEKEEQHGVKTTYLKNQYKKIMGKEYTDKSGVTINQHSISSLTNKLNNINEELEVKTSIRMKYVREQQDISSQISNWNKELITEMDKLGDFKVKQSQLETRIGYNLKTLNNDYKLTLQSIKDYKWELKETKDEVRKIVHNVKEELSILGYVNIEAVEQYEDIKERYESISKNYDELKAAQKKLLDTIEILDDKMEDSLKDTVKKIREKFQIVFKDIFRGGSADLKWEDENDILNSGIEVIAKPPGKEIKNISLFSGGEKSMIAVTLIFAILQVSKLPLLILDEAEAALDEANVDRYARYCLELNKLTQVILVTHRPGTMENCDLLYGVTMEQKGITKLLSIKLDQAKKMIK